HPNQQNNESEVRPEYYPAQSWQEVQVESLSQHKPLNCRPHISMSTHPPPNEYLVICRGQWDQGLSTGEIQNAIDQFYAWYDRSIKEGKMKRGRRFTFEGKTISRKRLITDGPFGESKEVIGGFWLILGHSLEEAAQIAQGNPLLEYSHFMEVRPIDP